MFILEHYSIPAPGLNTFIIWVKAKYLEIGLLILNLIIIQFVLSYAEALQI